MDNNRARNRRIERNEDLESITSLTGIIGYRPVGSMSAVAALPVELQFVSDSQDVQPIKEYLGSIAEGYDAFFVNVVDGDYSEVWGIVGIVPHKSKLTSRLK